MATVVSNMQVVNQLGQDVTLIGFLASSNPQKLPSEEKTYVIKAGTTATLDPLVALKTTITATIGTVAYAFDRLSLSPSGTPLDFQYVVKLDGNVMTFLPQAIKVVKDPADLHLDYGLSMGVSGNMANISGGQQPPYGSNILSVGTISIKHIHETTGSCSGTDTSGRVPSECFREFSVGHWYTGPIAQGNVYTLSPQRDASGNLQVAIAWVPDVGTVFTVSRPAQAPSTTEPSLAQMWTGRSRHHQGDSASSSTFIGIAATVALWMIVLLMLIGVILIGVRGKA